MPAWELFEAQDQAYRDEVLPPAVKARLSVEAGVTLGWERWVGDAGDSIGVDGRSARRRRARRSWRNSGSRRRTSSERTLALVEQFSGART